MSEQLANEEEKENNRKRDAGKTAITRSISKRRKTNQQENRVGVEEGEECDAKMEPTIWEQWVMFLSNEENTRHLMQLRYNTTDLVYLP